MRGVVKGGLNDSGGGTFGIGDWSAYETLHNWSQSSTAVPANSFGTVLDVTGEGALMFARADTFASGAINPDIRVTVDGESCVFEGLNAGATRQGNQILTPIYFNSSLKIEIYNRTASATAFQLDYTYLRKIGQTGNQQSILSSSSRKMAQAVNTSSSDLDVVNIVGSGYLLSVEFFGYYTNLGGLTRGTVTIDGANLMTNRSVFSSIEAGYKHSYFGGPIRFNSGLRVIHSNFNNGAAAMTRVWYTLD